MPTYSYKCNECRWAADVYTQQMSNPEDDEFKICPACGAKIRRLIGSGGGIIFKGPGFYATDYRKDSKS